MSNRPSRRRDRRRMNRALGLARLNQGLTGVNPSVGCVLTDADGHVVGEGVTGIGGRPHAEEIALQQAGERARGGTAYVTLEPCRERSQGNKSCSLLLREAGIARVVCAVEDPHPVANGGIRALRDAGIHVQIGLGQRSSQQLYRKFFQSIL